MTFVEALAWLTSWPERWASETGAGWAATDRDRVVGQLSLRTPDLAEGLSDVSYWVIPGARGKGVAPRALSVLASWAFWELGMHRLEVEHSTANDASCRAALKAGFLLEGTRRGAGLHQDGWHDMHLHARLASDPPGDSSP